MHTFTQLWFLYRKPRYSEARIWQIHDEIEWFFHSLTEEIKLLFLSIKGKTQSFFYIDLTDQLLLTYNILVFHIQQAGEGRGGGGGQVQQGFNNVQALPGSLGSSRRRPWCTRTGPSCSRSGGGAVQWDPSGPEYVHSLLSQILCRERCKFGIVRVTQSCTVSVTNPA